MSESLMERLQRHADTEPNTLHEYFATDILEVIQAIKHDVWNEAIEAAAQHTNKRMVTQQVANIVNEIRALKKEST